MHCVHICVGSCHFYFTAAFRHCLGTEDYIHIQLKFWRMRKGRWTQTINLRKEIEKKEKSVLGATKPTRLPSRNLRAVPMLATQ